jgi:hypothetical protein
MMEDPSTRTYILERTRGFFAGRFDEPYSGLHVSNPAQGLRVSGPPAWGLLRFGLPPRRRLLAPLSARGLTLRPQRRLEVVLGSHPG